MRGFLVKKRGIVNLFFEGGSTHFRRKGYLTGGPCRKIVHGRRIYFLESGPFLSERLGRDRANLLWGP